MKHVKPDIWNKLPIGKNRIGALAVLASALMLFAVLGGCGTGVSVSQDRKNVSETVSGEVAEDGAAERQQTASDEAWSETRTETDLPEETLQQITRNETTWEESVSASTPITNASYEVITKYLRDLGFVPTMWSDTWDNWLYVIDDHHANLILIEDPADFPYGNYMLFIAVPLSCEQKVHWDDEASVASLANEAEDLEKDVLYELLTEEEVKEVIASYGR